MAEDVVPRTDPCFRSVSFILSIPFCDGDEVRMATLSGYGPRQVQEHLDRLRSSGGMDESGHLVIDDVDPDKPAESAAAWVLLALMSEGIIVRKRADQGPDPVPRPARRHEAARRT